MKHGEVTVLLKLRRIVTEDLANRIPKRGFVDPNLDGVGGYVLLNGLRLQSVQLCQQGIDR